MTETPPDDQSETRPRRPSRRRLWWALGVSGALFTAWAAVIIYSDAEPPDVSDLALVPIQVRDAENFYLALVKRGEAIKAAPIIRDDEPEEVKPPPTAETAAEPEPEPTAASGEVTAKPLRERLLAGDDWTPERLSRWLPALDVLDVECREIAKLEKAQGTIPSSFAETVPTAVIRELSYQLRLAVWARYQAGRQADALETAWLGLDTGRRLADARGCLIDYLTALAIQGTFQATLHDVAARDDVERATLDAILGGLVARPTGTDAYAHTLRNEVGSGIRLFHSLTAAEVAKSGSVFGRSPDPAVIVAKTRILYPLVYKPNLTVAIYAEHMRTHIRIYDLPLDERKIRSPKFDEELSVRVLFQPYNLLGRIFLGMIIPSLDSMAMTRHLTFSRQSLLSVFVALRLYHMDHGTLPATLDELVPAYLPAVPLDYVDRQPIRYSRDARVVWSVGRKNLQITAADQEIDEREVFYRLDFPAPPPAAGSASATGSDAPGPSP